MLSQRKMLSIFFNYLPENISFEENPVVIKKIAIFSLNFCDYLYIIKLFFNTFFHNQNENFI